MSKSRAGSIVVVATMVTAGCLGEQSSASVSALEGRRQSAEEYAAAFVRAQTEVGPTAEVLRRTRREGGVVDVDVLFDASEGRTEFPLPERVRHFEDDRALQEFLRSELGLNARGGTYAVLGTPYYEDRSSSVRYAVTDPVAAYLGGRTGLVVVAEQERCLDPDGDCADGVASYLRPDAELTRPTHVNVPGTNGVVGAWHSFFNKTYFPWPWARHGSNAGINVAPLPSTRITVTCQIWKDYGGGGERQSMMCGMVSQVNVQSAETAVWMAAPGNLLSDAEAVCGFGEINDQDIPVGFQVQTTGNGPQNNFFCGV